tara:strand:+ start:1 stop:783 length:783 start_codon:yes stop_codon:yes gene_type:complete
MNILEKICFFKRQEISKLKEKHNIDFFLKNADILKRHFFIKKLKEKRSEPNIITEIKKKSPSAGLIKKKFDFLQIAQEYEKAGASCLSILTESKYFGGNINSIKKIKSIVNLPILRKDFIVDEWQIYESFYHGADCILLIAAILNDKLLEQFYAVAKQLNLDVIFEIHDKEELNRVLELSAACIGVNNRNLKTLEVNLNTFKDLSQIIPNNIVKICESGISTKKEISEMMTYGADAFLVGESLMKEEDIFTATRSLISNE